MRTLAETLAWAAGVVASLTVLIAAFIKARNWMHTTITPRLNTFDDALLLLQGRPAISKPESPNVIIAPPLPGALERLAAIEEALSAQVEYLIAEVHEVKSELKHNGGGSVKDAVTRIEQTQAIQNVRLHNLEQATTQRVEMEQHIWPLLRTLTSFVDPDPGVPGVEVERGVPDDRGTGPT